MDRAVVAWVVETAPLAATGTGPEMRQTINAVTAMASSAASIAAIRK